jgi:hypothetical protein
VVWIHADRLAPILGLHQSYGQQGPPVAYRDTLRMAFLVSEPATLSADCDLRGLPAGVFDPTRRTPPWMEATIGSLRMGENACTLTAVDADGNTGRLPFTVVRRRRKLQVRIVSGQDQAGTAGQPLAPLVAKVEVVDPDTGAVLGPAAGETVSFEGDIAGRVVSDARGMASSAPLMKGKVFTDQPGRVSARLADEDVDRAGPRPAAAAPRSPPPTPAPTASGRTGRVRCATMERQWHAAAAPSPPGRPAPVPRQQSGQAAGSVGDEN